MKSNANVIRNSLSLFFIYLYVLIAPLGTLFRFSEHEGALGVSSILLLILVFMFSIDMIYVFFKNQFFFYLFLLLIILLFTSMNSYDPSSTYLYLVQLSIYVSFAAAIYRVSFSRKDLKLVFLFLAIGTFISTFLTLIDYSGLMDIPRVNELQIVTRLGGENVQQISGLFPRRSAMAAYFALILPIFFVLSIQKKNIYWKLFLSLCFLLSFLCLLFTHNLAGIIAILVSCFFYLIFGYRATFLEKIKKISIILLILLAFGTIISLKLPEIVDVYLFRIGSHFQTPSTQVNGLLDRQIESDNMRLYFFKFSLASINGDPFGHGLSKLVTDKYGIIDPHNIITQFIWATGILGFIWMFFGILIFFKIIKLPKYSNDSLTTYLTAIKYGLFSWFICGMAHNIIFTGIAWLFLGMLINIRKQLYKIPQRTR